MEYQFYCYPKCTTCAKARKWLVDHDIAFEERNIKINNPTLKEITRLVRMSNLPLKRFFNTSGQQYRSLELAKKLPEMSEKEQFELLSSDGMLVKRPILTNGENVLVGFKQEEWEDLLLKKE